MICQIVLLVFGNSQQYLYNTLGSHKVFLFGGLRWAAAFDKGGLDAVLLAEVPVGRPRVACVAAYLLHIHPEQALVHLDAVLQTRPLVEGVER